MSKCQFPVRWAYRLNLWPNRSGACMAQGALDGYGKAVIRMPSLTWGFMPGAGSPCSFYHPTRELNCVVHEVDFFVVCLVIWIVSVIAVASAARVPSWCRSIRMHVASSSSSSAPSRPQHHHHLHHRLLPQHPLSKWGRHGSCRHWCQF